MDWSVKNVQKRDVLFTNNRTSGLRRYTDITRDQKQVESQ